MLTSRIGLVACCGQKLDGSHSAGAIYQSALFLKSKQWVLDHCQQWFILSAKYGLLAPDTMIESYNLTLNTMSAPARREWAARVREQLAPHAGARFVVLAGERYCAALDGLDVERPLRGLGIGEQLAWLTKQNAIGRA